MRDLKMVSGRKQYVDEVEDALALVRNVYPTATREGSLGSWSFWVGKLLIGEAWLHRDKPGWWLRIAETPVEVH